jgi:hypothetical protein
LRPYYTIQAIPYPIEDENERQNIYREQATTECRNTYVHTKKARKEMAMGAGIEV